MREQRSTGRRRRWRLGLASGCAAALCLVTLPGASADGGDDPFPSRERVRQAQQQVKTTADKVEAIKAQLAAADQRLEGLTVAAAKAAEAYNGARYELQQARTAARRAQRTAAAASARVGRIQDKLSISIVTDIQNGGPLTSLGVLISDPDPNALLEQLNAYQGVTGAMQGNLERYESAKIVATVLQDRAEAALQDQREATAKAAEAKRAAEDAAAAAQAAVAGIAAEKQTLVRRLARVQDISVQLAQQRQQALAERAAEQAAAQARREARQQAKREAERQARQAEQDQADRPGQSGADNSGNDPPPADSDPPPAPTPAPAPAPTPAPAPAPAHGASAAIAFAKAQLGEPYVYGAAGPDSWDCSGLTMQAWAAAGVSLSHWSVAQYLETTPISFSQLRPGDLLFWGESGSPASIYHVAMYLGDGMMIQAPRPGRSVEIVSIYYWILPNFYSRV